MAVQKGSALWCSHQRLEWGVQLVTCRNKVPRRPLRVPIHHTDEGPQNVCESEGACVRPTGYKLHTATT
eukprot:1023705-Prymnesium_polylepis.1